MPSRKEVRWFTRGEFSQSAISHEGDEDGQETFLGYRKGEKLLGKGSSIYSFTSAFRPLTAHLNKEGNRKDLVTIDGG
jgi:ligand-binding sensor domain-containing protein